VNERTLVNNNAVHNFHVTHIYFIRLILQESKFNTIMNYQNSQQNSHSVRMYSSFKSFLKKFGYVCAPTIDGQIQVDYFVVSDYDGLQLDSK